MESIGHLRRLEILMVLRKCAIQQSLNLVYTAVVFTFLCIGLTLPSESSAQGFFGPKDYDDCILQNMRGVTSDTAAGLVHRSCLSKFPKEESKVQNHLDAKGDLGKVNVCEVFWNGRKFSKGIPKTGFKTLMFAFYGVESHHVALPNEMVREFESRNSKFDMNDPKDPWSDFWRTHYYDIQVLCPK